MCTVLLPPGVSPTAVKKYIVTTTVYIFDQVLIYMFQPAIRPSSGCIRELKKTEVSNRNFSLLNSRIQPEDGVIASRNM